MVTCQPCGEPTTSVSGESVKSGSRPALESSLVRSAPPRAPNGLESRWNAALQGRIRRALRRRRTIKVGCPNKRSRAETRDLLFTVYRSEAGPNGLAAKGDEQMQQLMVDRPESSEIMANPEFTANGRPGPLLKWPWINSAPRGTSVIGHKTPTATAAPSTTKKSPPGIETMRAQSKAAFNPRSGENQPR